MKKVHETIERGGKVILYFVVEVFVFLYITLWGRDEGFTNIQCKCSNVSMLSFQVLIPVFALGRAQELCILLETFW